MTSVLPQDYLPFHSRMPDFLAKIPKGQPQQHNANLNRRKGSECVSITPRRKPRDDGIGKAKSKNILQTDDEKCCLSSGRIITINHKSSELRLRRDTVGHRDGWKSSQPKHNKTKSKIWNRPFRLMCHSQSIPKDQPVVVTALH
jgi:hypothetical protein